MPGPAPKPASHRRRRNTPIANTLQLPAEGRKGSAPEWPLLSHRADEADLRVWEQLWATPHAVAWERLGWTRVVARYVRLIVLEEAGDESSVSAALLGEVRQLEDRLGLTPMSMLRLRWEIVEDEVKEQRAAKAAPSARKRLRAVD